MKIKGYASLFNVPDGARDITIKYCFKRSLKEIPPKMLINHVSYPVIGKWLDIFEDDVGLMVVGEILDEDAIKLIKKENIDGLSIGFITKVKNSVDNNRFLVDVDLHEISITKTPLAKDARFVIEG